MNTKLKRPSTEDEDLPITQYVDKNIDFVSLNEDISYKEFIEKISTIEQASQKKIREEETNRMVGILDEMKEGYKGNDGNWNASFILQEVKERILSTN